MAIRFFTTTATPLLLEITLVYMFTTLKPWGKWGSSPPFRDWCYYMHVVSQEQGFHLANMYFGLTKAVPTSSFFVILTASFKSVRSTVWFVSSFPLNWKSYSKTCQQSGRPAIYSKETDNLSILLLLNMLMIQLMVFVPRVTQYLGSKESRIWYN